MSEPQSTVASVIDSRRREADYFQKVREFILEFIERSQKKKEPHVAIWDECFENYLVAFDTQAQSGGKLITSANLSLYAPVQQLSTERRSKLKDPETHQIVETLAAQALGLLIGDRDYIQAVPLNPERVNDARRLEKTLMGTLDGSGNFRTIYEVLKDSFIFGTSIIEMGWEERSRKAVDIETILDPETGERRGRRQVVRDVLYRRRPLLKQVERYDFYPDPSGTRIQQNMKGVAKRFRLTKDEFIANCAKKVYNVPDACRRVLERLEQRKAKITDDQEVGGPEAPLPPIAVDEFGHLVGFEYWGFVPVKSKDGVQNRVCTMIGGEIVRDAINPFYHGKLPFKEVVMNPISGRFWGLSPAEAIRYIQDGIDNMLMLVNDAADLAVRSPLLYGSKFQGNPLELRRRGPNSAIFAGDVTSVAPLEVDIGALQAGMQFLGTKKQMAREASGATDPVQAIPSGGRKTAFEMKVLSQAASQRVGMSVQLVERDDFPWLGVTTHERLKQFIPDEGMIATYNGEAVPFSYDDLDLEADIAFVGSRHGMSQSEKLEATQQAIGLIGQNPQILELLPDLVIRLMRDGLKFSDAEKLVTEAAKRFKQMEQQRMQQELALKQSGPPKGGGM